MARPRKQVNNVKRQKPIVTKDWDDKINATEQLLIEETNTTENMNEVEENELKALYRDMLQRQEKMDAQQREIDETIELLKKHNSTTPEADSNKLLKEVALEIAKGTISGLTSDTYEMKLSTELPIEPSDVLETPAYFRAERVAHIITHDMQNGVYVDAPHGQIVFMPEGTKIVRDDSRHQTQINYSRYYCRSKKEYQFLKNHFQNNVIFYEISDKNKLIKSKNEYIVDASNKVASMNREGIDRECIRLNIDRGLSEKEKYLILVDIYAKVLEDTQNANTEAKLKRYHEASTL